MGYLILQDFKKLIQTDNLAAIIGDDYTILDQAISAAETEIASYLVQKYDIAREFTSLAPWDKTRIYAALDRFYLDADIYSASKAYNTGDLVYHNNKVYRANQDTTAEAFNVSRWDLLGARYAMFFGQLPHEEFNFDTTYKNGDLVYWKGKTYTAQLSTLAPSHQSNINYPSYASIPAVNVAPDDRNSGAKVWGTGTAYAIPAGALPTDSDYWIAGDNRNAQLVNCTIDVALYTLHSRISPINIPDLRVKRYDDVIRWLKNAAQGLNISAAIPTKQPAQGERIRWGGDVRKNYQF